MRSFENAPSAPPQKSTVLTAAAFAALFGNACELTHHTGYSLEMEHRIKTEGTPRTAHEVLNLALPFNETATPASAFETLQVVGDWRSSTTNAHYFAQHAQQGYRVVATEQARDSVNHVVIPFATAANHVFEGHRLRLLWTERRVEVRDTTRNLGDQSAVTELISQQTSAQPDAETLPVSATPLLIEHTGRNRSETLARIFYSFVRPSENQPNQTMATMANDSDGRQVIFRGEDCGRVTTKGLTNSIYCMREVHEVADVVIDRIQETTLPNGLVTVRVAFHDFNRTVPATPGR